jgi:hypothetical protein
MCTNYKPSRRGCTDDFQNYRICIYYHMYMLVPPHSRPPKPCIPADLSPLPPLYNPPPLPTSHLKPPGLKVLYLSTICISFVLPHTVISFFWFRLTADSLLLLVADLLLDAAGQLHILLALPVQLAQLLKLLHGKRTRAAGRMSWTVFIHRFYLCVILFESLLSCLVFAKLHNFLQKLSI